MLLLICIKVRPTDFLKVPHRSCPRPFFEDLHQNVILSAYDKWLEYQFVGEL